MKSAEYVKIVASFDVAAYAQHVNYALRMRDKSTFLNHLGVNVFVYY